MQLRSGRRLVYPPPEPAEGAHRRRRRSQHSSEDRISGLPEDLLLAVLARLRSPAEAARAGAVCRGWRGLWTDLPELYFYGAQPLHAVSTLASVTRPSLDLLFINLWADWADGEDWSEELPFLLHGAARLSPEKLTVMVSWAPATPYAVDLPCFEHTSYISLDLMGSLQIRLPQYGEFTALKSLHLESCCIDLGALLPLCPCLRILNIKDLSVDTVVVHSPSLEEFVLEVHNYDIGCIDIAAPVLKEATLDVDIAKGFRLSFSAPMVKIRWGCYFLCVCEGFGQIWRLVSIKEHELDDFHVVSLKLASYANIGLLGAEWSIAQVIAHLPVTVFSVLELHLETDGGHAFGPIMLRLLRIQPTIQRLKVVLARCHKVRVSCPVNCPCEQPSNWRSEDVSLANLEVVEIHGLEGKDDEVDFLNIILRCAAVLQRLTMTISDDISSSNNGYEKICKIMEEYPDVEYHVMASGSEGALYP